MPGCCTWNCFGLCFRRHRQSTSSTAPDGNAPIELVNIVHPAVPAGHPAVPPAESDHPSDLYQYGNRQRWGELRQRWIDDANEPNCTVKPLDFEFQDLTHNKNRTQRWTTKFNRWGPVPPVLQGDLRNCGLPTGEQDYHDVKIIKESVVWHPIRGTGTNFHQITTAMGVIILRNVRRYDGPHWSEVAHAQYNVHFDQNTLRHIYLENVINEDTRVFIETIWARMQPPNTPGFRDSPESLNQVAWAYDTPEYQAILGTELGKGVAAIVLSAFPRGTRRITRIVVWRKTVMQIRFDIEHKDYLDTPMEM
ncbi:uncharacterized protein N7500_001030 [Penicillium coprophilum]|uniref:uncharacterized protein n=1 Tax=Penicillium coprophilum TaxID=36646 RepID=UPI0023A6EDBA|nr:uncharacterized protein N7500_001030 [Penicillium coprophilum]KAJ5178331.1 hypothetical protein N7500_001030 [Penicillium coprophilum]